MISLAWIYLIVGGICEVGFVTTMKLSNGFKRFKYTMLTILFMALSFYTLSLALKDIPMGVGYAVWAGIGSVGSVLVGMIWFKESKGWMKILFMTMIVLGIVGLRLSAA